MWSTGYAESTLKICRTVHALADSRQATNPIPRQDALARHVVISHRWVTQNSADPSGTQYEVIKKYLEDHPDVEKVWGRRMLSPVR